MGWARWRVAELGPQAGTLGGLPVALLGLVPTEEAQTAAAL